MTARYPCADRPVIWHPGGVHYDLIIIGNHFAHSEEPCEPSQADKILEALPVPVIVVNSTGK